MGKEEKIALIVVALLCLGGCQNVRGSVRSFKLQLPPQTLLKVEGVSLEGNPNTGQYTLQLPANPTFPIIIEATGPLGGKVRKEIPSFDALAALQISTGIVSDPEPNPQSLAVLPMLCPRLQERRLAGIATKNSTAPETQPTTVVHYLYEGSRDRLNHIPSVQLTDPDAWEGEEYKAYSEMDGKNVMLLKKIRLTYDYEDSNILEYDGPHPLTGEKETIRESQNGFYANLHYAIVPFDPLLLTLDSQTLLHAAQGRLKELNLEKLRPLLRTHSFLPGPFLSRNGGLYPMCEWGDTAYQAPVQELEYEDMALWDWDYSVKNSDHVLLILWESDEENELVKKRLIQPTFLMDDLVGIFEIKKQDLVKPLTLKNPKGDLEITLQTGNLPHPPEPLLQRAFSNLP